MRSSQRERWVERRRGIKYSGMFCFLVKRNGGAIMCMAGQVNDVATKSQPVKWIERG